MSAGFHLLPSRMGSAAENMAVDFLLLQRYPDPAAIRFRHYGWHRPAVTFGYGQKIAEVRAALAGDERLELCRRPTGGGIVEHRQDWTYALVIPRGHEAEAVPAPLSYRLVHTALAAALQAQGVPAQLAPEADEVPEQRGRRRVVPAGVCFERAEPADVVHCLSGRKLAGAAQKRNRSGLLFQGSIARAELDPGFDWERWAVDFPGELAAALGAQREERGWPEFEEEEVSALTEQYASPEWLEHR